MKKIRSSFLGFTLIEIVVVIAIVALLFAAGVTSYAKVRVSSRDAIRKSDLLNIRNALEQYRNINTAYPTTITQLVTDGYLPTEPKDPQVDCSYKYTGISSYSKYELCADFEIDGTYSCLLSNCTGTCNCDSPKLSNLQ